MINLNYTRSKTQHKVKSEPEMSQMSDSNIR